MKPLLTEAAAVGAGGFAGAVVRHLVMGLTGSTIGIITVNVAGCLVLGLLSQESKFALFAATGFLGALTTFSALSGHAVKLWTSGEGVTAALFVLMNLFAGLAAFIAGLYIRGQVAA